MAEGEHEWQPSTYGKEMVYTARLFDVRCPVMWLHATDDVVYSVANAEQEIKVFVNAPEASLVTVKGGAHFLEG